LAASISAIPSTPWWYVRKEDRVRTYPPAGGRSGAKTRCRASRFSSITERKSPLGGVLAQGSNTTERMPIGSRRSLTFEGSVNRIYGESWLEGALRLSLHF
jgi:hypothetical protein